MPSYSGRGGGGADLRTELSAALTAGVRAAASAAADAEVVVVNATPGTASVSALAPVVRRPS